MEEFCGFVNILKPTGMTSSDVVLKIKKILGTKRVGHLGTLDPAASGVLPVAVGKATKFFDYFLGKQKEYVARVVFGVQTDTLDSFGNITKIDNLANVEEDDAKKVLENFVGEIYQTPPKFSAVKIGGKKAYELARENINFELNKRKITIFQIKLVKKCEKNTFLFKVNCSAGTYIRTLFESVANALGIYATVPVIIRTKSGNFDISSAVTIEEFEAQKNIIPIEKIFDFLKICEINDSVAKKILNGVKVKKSELNLETGFDGEFLITYKGKVVGLYETKFETVLPKVFVY